MKSKEKDKLNTLKMTEFIKKYKDKLTYVLTLIIAISIIFIGAYIVQYKEDDFSKNVVENNYTYAKVKEIISVSEDEYEMFGVMSYLKVITFKAITKTDKVIIGIQKIDNVYPILSPEIKVGDDIILAYIEYEENYKTGDNAGYYQFIDFDRKISVIILIALFILAVIIFGKKKGVNTAIALFLAFVYIFKVYIPLVTAGSNIYVLTIFLCLYTTIVTLLLIAGASIKTLSAMLGCMGGLVVASIITIIYCHLAKVSGGGDEHTLQLLMLNETNQINIKAILFSSILIGSMGAVMDVGMSISSSLSEISRKVKDISFKELFKSGMDIGRDIVGTMANTLFLAYIGSSLCSIILLMSYNTLSTLIEKEIIIIEILNAVAGTIGIITTIPITSLISAFFFKNIKNKI